MADELQQALAMHQAGQLIQASLVNDHVLKQTPDHAEACHLRGVLHHQMGEHAQAADKISRSSRFTGAGTSTSASTSSTSAASTMKNGVWTPTKGKESYSDHGKDHGSFHDGGTEDAAVAGDKLSGPWSVSGSGNANYSITQSSVLGSGGLWLTTGTAAESGGGNGNWSGKESGTETLGLTGAGSITLTDADHGKDGDSYHGEQTLTAGGAWVSVSGYASSTSGSTSTASSSGGGTSTSTTAAGDTDHGHWSDNGNEHDSFSGSETATLGSDGVWVTSGSVTVKGWGSGGDSYSEKGKYEVSGNAGSSSYSGVSTSASSVGWDTGSFTTTSGGGSSSSNNFNAKYSLGSSGAWDAVSGSAFATETETAQDSISGKGEFGFTIDGGSDMGTWNDGGSDHASNTATVNGTLNSDGTWTTTGTDNGSGGGSWSSGDSGGGAFVIDTGTTGSGNWDDISGSVSESGGDNGGYSDSYQYNLGSGGIWQVVSGSASAHDTATEDVSVDETDNYGEEVGSGSGTGSSSTSGTGSGSGSGTGSTSGSGSGSGGGLYSGSGSVEVTGTKVEDDSVDITASASDDWSLGSGGSWTMTGSSSNATATIDDTLTDSFSGGSVSSGSDRDTLNETITESNGGTPSVSSLTVSATGSFTAAGDSASFSVTVNGDPNAPTTTLTETNTTDLNNVSSVSVDDIDSLDTALITAVVTAPNATPGSYSSTWTYNSAGDLMSATLTDSDGNTTAWRFNSAGQLTSRTLAYGTSQAATTTFGYDANGNLVSVTDPDGNVTTYTYNAQNEETSMTDPLGNTETMEYNDQGQLIEKTNRDGMYETYAYNTAGQLTQETWYAADGTETDQFNYTYNTAGQLVSASNDEGTYTFSYNAQGQVSGVTEPFGVSLSFTYDTNGNRVEVQDSFGGTTQSSYNANNQLVSEQFTATGQPTVLIDQSYNADGTVASRTYYSDAAGTDVVATTTYGYDSYGNVTSIVQTNANGTVLGDYTYSYDTSGDNLPSTGLPSGSSSSINAGILAAFLVPPEPGGSVSSETDNGDTKNYSYDASNQLVGYGNTTQSYDLNGNRDGSGYVIGPDNQLLSDGTYNYTYDADGNEASKTDIATGDTWTYGYNNADQLISAVETSADGTVETQVVIQYDVFGNRLQEQVWTPSTGWTTTRFSYDAWDPATPSGVGNENWKVWATLDGNNDLEMRYINGDGLDQVFAQISASGSVAWYLTDRLGSTRALVDNNGNVLDAISYDAWGNITSQTAPSAQPLFMFTGIAFDARMGLYFNGNGGREYDPKTGRFIEQDPMRSRAGDSNLYRYVGNDPKNVIDPSGLEWHQFFPPPRENQNTAPVDFEKGHSIAIITDRTIPGDYIEGISLKNTVRNISGPKAFIFEIGKYQSGYFDAIVVSGHADGLGVKASQLSIGSRTLTNDEWKFIGSKLCPNGVLVIQSCDAGRNPSEMVRLAKLIGYPVIANDGEVAAGGYGDGYWVTAYPDGTITRSKRR